MNYLQHLSPEQCVYETGSSPRRVYGDSAHPSQQHLCASKAPRVKDFINDRVRNNRGEIDEVRQATNRNKLRIRARVEHVFCVVKRRFGFNKVSYRGPGKECDASVHGVGTGQHLPGSRSPDDTGPFMRAKTGRDTGTHGPKAANEAPLDV